MLIQKLLSVLTVSLFLVMLPINATGQSSDGDASSTSEKTSKTESQKNIINLVSKLSKSEIEILSKLLKAITSVDAPEISPTSEGKGNIATAIQSLWRDYSTFIWSNVVALPTAISTSANAVLKAVSGRGAAGNLLFYLYIVLMLGAGAIFAFAAGKIARLVKKRTDSRASESNQDTFKSAVFDISLKIAKVVVFAVGAIIAAKFLFSNATDHFFATSLIYYGALIVWPTVIILRFVLAPKEPANRLVSIDDWNANYIFRNFVILSVIIAATLYLLQVIGRFQIGDDGPFRFWVGQYVFVSLLYITWRARHGISAIIRGGEDNLTPGLEKMAAWWPVLSMVILTLLFVTMQLGNSSGAMDMTAGDGIISVALIVFAPFFDTMLRALINRFAPAIHGEGDVAEAAYNKTKHAYVRIGRLVLLTLLFVSIGKIWGINYRELTEQGFGAQLAASGGGFLLILATGYLVWELANLWVNRQLANEMPVTETGAAEEGGAGKSRLATILPLVSMTIQVAIVIMTVFLGLSQLGLDITPLLAGAGVFGLAIGFGAQTLVKDIVSGVFCLWDDAFRVGEFIDVGGTVGTVEKISIRSLQLRHPNGPVHIIPYGEIPKLTNNSRDYVIMKLRFTVPFDTDLEKVRKLFKKIGQEMMQVPELAENFILPFKSQGVVDVDDVGIVLRGKFTTKPGAQWIIRKEIYSRVQKAFEDNDIQFARKEVWVQMPELDNQLDGDSVNKQVMKAAAAAVSEDAKK